MKRCAIAYRQKGPHHPSHPAHTRALYTRRSQYSSAVRWLKLRAREPSLFFHFIRVSHRSVTFWRKSNTANWKAALLNIPAMKSPLPPPPPSLTLALCLCCLFYFNPSRIFVLIFFFNFIVMRQMVFAFRLMRPSTVYLTRAWRSLLSSHHQLFIRRRQFKSCATYINSLEKTRPSLIKKKKKITPPTTPLSLKEGCNLYMWRFFFSVTLFHMPIWYANSLCC